MVINFEPGKLTEEAKTHLPDVTELELRRRARSFGMTVSEYLRDLVCIDIHGSPFDDLVREHRRALRCAQGPGLGQVQSVLNHGGAAQ